MVGIKNCTLSTLAAVLLSLPIQPVQAAEAKFDITTPPSKAEWQHFNRMKPSQLKALWQFQYLRGNKTLNTWAWQWRLGWIKQCAQQNSLAELCHTILKEGLNDEAMVVRAEAAYTLGLINRGKASKPLVQSLARAYVDPRNSRNGNPLFVCDRILGALHSMGDQYAEQTANRLANKHPSTALYWTKMHRQSP